MNSNVDVLQELAVKNKGIYINKLEIDLDTNLENILITINNLISLFTTEVTEKILELASGQLSKEKVNEKVSTFQKGLQDELINLLTKRKELLQEKVQDIDNINYRDILNQETLDILNKIKDFYKMNIDGLIKELSINIHEFDKNRLNDYLKILYYERFINKIKDAIINMDIILNNSYEEGYQRFLDLNAKTLK